jgi:hypothetical protein
MRDQWQRLRVILRRRLGLGWVTVRAEYWRM